MGNPRGDKPEKPYPDFPMFPHATGRWAKKINGKFHYFGPWEDWKGAIEKFNREFPYIQAGQRPPAIDESGVTVRDVVNAFLTEKYAAAERGEISDRTVHEYHQNCEQVVAELRPLSIVTGLQPLDFDRLKARFAKTKGITAQGNEIQRTRTLFKWAYDQALIDAPLRMPNFRKPPAVLYRKHKKEKGREDFSRDEVLALLDKAESSMRAMILLGVNCGFGNDDVSGLEIADIDFETGWHDYHRRKTYIERRSPLWPETLEALKAVMKNRKEPKKPELKQRFFVTSHGNPWVQYGKKGRCGDRVTRVFLLTKRAAGIDRAGVGFYGLRRTAATVARRAKDPEARSLIMGHAKKADDMAARYVQDIADEDLVAVTNYSRQWLFGDQVGQLVVPPDAIAT